jgi:hypothetical protein
MLMSPFVINVISFAFSLHPSAARAVTAAGRAAARATLLNVNTPIAFPEQLVRKSIVRQPVSIPRPLGCHLAAGSSLLPLSQGLTDRGSCPQVEPGDDFESEVRRVLVIYTGGTLGMTMQNGSLAPKKGFLQQRILEMPEVYAATMPDLDVIEYDPLIDSSNVSPQDWSRLALQIRDSYYDYDGFVILHGTDTMAYTASALSFMLEGLGKAVVLTGSMIPLAEVFNDARRNLLISIVRHEPPTRRRHGHEHPAPPRRSRRAQLRLLRRRRQIFAAQLELCECAIFFNDRLLRGNRAVKVDSNSLSIRSAAPTLGWQICLSLSSASCDRALA